MSGNTLGALKGRLTKHYREWLKIYNDDKQQEIRENQGRWSAAIDELKSIDKNFDEWYDGDAIPDYILWTGEEFEMIFKIVSDRLEEKRNESY
jgi:hypothetical protein